MNADLKARLHLIEANRPLLAIALGKVLAGGGDATRVAIMVIDTRDPIGEVIARVAVERQPRLDLGEHRERVLLRGEIPTAILVLDVTVAQAVLADTNPTVAARLGQTPSARRVRVIAVAEGGTLLVHSVVEPSPSAGLA